MSEIFWEPYYVPSPSSRKGKAPFRRKYPGLEIRYGVEARWDDSQGRDKTTMVAVRGYTENMIGERLWSGPERKNFAEAKSDALNAIPGRSKLLA